MGVQGPGLQYIQGLSGRGIFKTRAKFRGMLRTCGERESRPFATLLQGLDLPYSIFITEFKL